MDQALEPPGDAPDLEASGPAAGPAHRPRSATRATVEFLVVLAMGILLARTFAAEAYIVPTGSMAPTLLGMHRAFTCPDCGLRYVLGMDEDGRAGRPVCPNCGCSEPGRSEAVDGYGDRLLVQKYLFDFRPPRRWEVAVFRNPEDPTQAYVKRVVGLPGEAIEIRGGDVYADGRICRKSPAEARAMRQLVFDNDHLPPDIDRFPRWLLRHGAGRDRFGIVPSGWKRAGTAFVREPTGIDEGRPDWLEYRHYQPERRNFGPVRDFIAYNGGDGPADHRVDDLMLDAEVATRPDCRALAVRLSSGADRFVVTIPVDRKVPLEVRRNGRRLEVAEPGAGLTSSSAEAPKFQKLEAALLDRRLTIAVDGRALFEPIDYDDPAAGPAAQASPLGLGLVGGGGVVRGLKVFRDVFYTDALAHAPRRPFAVGTPYKLGEGEFFVLGDNSPVSNDSRFWSDSPVVRADALLGKPFLVHLPSQAVPLKVFGREVYWIPDPREIRYIR